jgi:uncharacterized repeat protein (TIGR03806 family)
MRSRVVVSCMALLLASCGGGGGGGGSASTPPPSSAAFGLDSRVAPSSVQIPTGPIGSGSQSLRAVNAFPGLNIGNVTVLTHADDGSNRLFAAQRPGTIVAIVDRSSTPRVVPFLDISSRVDTTTEGGLLGLTFDPQYESNGYFYVLYATPSPSGRNVILSRFSVSAPGANSANPASERVLFQIDHDTGFHFGGWIGFGPDGMLYISRGDNGNPVRAQDPTLLYGKMLRGRVNNTVDPPRLDVPADNPSFGGGAPNLVWAMGLRNPWRCSFDRAGNGNLWCGDVGEGQREEVNLIRRGANYGWPYYEGELVGPYAPTPVPPYSDFAPATYLCTRDHCNSIIGGYVYRGPTLSGMSGRYLYVDFVRPYLYAMQTDGSDNFVAPRIVADNIDTNVQTLGEDQAGEVYAAAYAGTIYRFEATTGTPGGDPMPTTLSATGLFSDTPALTAAPGVIDYSVNAPFWSNGASKRRWFVLPEGQTIGFSADGNWNFPVGTITVKHFDLGTTKVETRVMVHSSEGWRGYSYRWRPDGQEADLVAEGGDSGNYAAQVWNFPSRGQCLQCHTAATGRALGLNTRQFNGNHSYAATGRSDNQLRTLNHIGIFSSDIGAPTQYGAMPNPTDASASLEARARAYLDTNCSICHQPNGGTPIGDMDLRYITSLSGTNIVGVASQAGSPRVAPGNPAGSDVVRRVGSTDAAIRMPPVGVQVTDTEGLQLLTDWISALPQ